MKAKQAPSGEPDEVVDLLNNLRGKLPNGRQRQGDLITDRDRELFQAIDRVLPELGLSADELIAQSARLEDMARRFNARLMELRRTDPVHWEERIQSERAPQDDLNRELHQKLLPLYNRLLEMGFEKKDLWT